MNFVEDIETPSLPILQACIALGVSRASMYRRTTLERLPSSAKRAPSPRKLSENERQAILDVLHSEPFMDQPPPEVYATLLSQGVYMASIRTMYRVLAKQGESAERRAQRAPMKHMKPTLTATAPNQVWTWDITKLRTVIPGVLLSLYVIIDLFSRMVVGWLLAGVHAPTSGTMEFLGKPVTITDPSAALNLGIATVFQDLALCENLDVVANIFLGRELNPMRLDEVAMETRAWTLRIAWC